MPPSIPKVVYCVRFESLDSSEAILAHECENAVKKVCRPVEGSGPDGFRPEVRRVATGRQGRGDSVTRRYLLIRLLLVRNVAGDPQPVHSRLGSERRSLRVSFLIHRQWMMDNDSGDRHTAHHVSSAAQPV